MVILGKAFAIRTVDRDAAWSVIALWEFPLMRGDLAEGRALRRFDCCSTLCRDDFCRVSEHARLDTFEQRQAFVKSMLMERLAPGGKGREAWIIRRHQSIDPSRLREALERDMVQSNELGADQ